MAASAARRSSASDRELPLASGITKTRQSGDSGIAGDLLRQHRGAAGSGRRARAPNLERRQTDASAHASRAVASTQSVVAGVVARDDQYERWPQVGDHLHGRVDAEGPL